MTLPSSLNIECASFVDCDSIARLHTKSWKEAYRGMLSDHYLDFEVDNDRRTIWHDRFNKPKQNQHIICCRSQEEIVAFVCAFFCDDDEYGTFIDNLHVSAEYRNRGLGVTLVREVIKTGVEKHADSRVFLWVLASNLPAIKFYERIGGRRVEEAFWTSPDGGSHLKYRYIWNKL